MTEKQLFWNSLDKGQKAFIKELVEKFDAKFAGLVIPKGVVALPVTKWVNERWTDEN